jgi:hypothetical protein
MKVVSDESRQTCFYTLLPQNTYMTTATLELYNALIEAGVDKERAEAAVRAVVSKELAKEFATKADIVELKPQLVMWMAGFHIASLGALAAILAQLN